MNRWLALTTSAFSAAISAWWALWVGPYFSHGNPLSRSQASHPHSVVAISPPGRGAYRRSRTPHGGRLPREPSGFVGHPRFAPPRNSGRTFDDGIASSEVSGV